MIASIDGVDSIIHNRLLSIDYVPSNAGVLYAADVAPLNTYEYQPIYALIDLLES